MNRFLNKQQIFNVVFVDPDSKNFVIDLVESEEVEHGKFVVEKNRVVLNLCRKLTSFKQHAGSVILGIHKMFKGDVVLNCLPEDVVEIAFGYFASSYSYVEEKEKFALHINENLISEKEKINEIIKIATIYCSHKHCMDAPANILNPESFVQFVNDYVGDEIRHVVYNASAIEEMGMGCIQAVSKASSNEPYVSVMYLNESLPGDPIVLIGKGVMFDSGGLSLKPSNYMLGMQSDMAGASIVFHLIKLIIEFNLNIKVIGINGLVENSVNGNAYRPTDIIKSMSGKTVEIRNTDAEGRLVLADLMVLAEKLTNQKQVKACLDFATLTGAASVSVGANCAYFYTYNEQIKNIVMERSLVNGDRFHPMPTFCQYKYALQSTVADIANCSTVNLGAGSSTGAAFIEDFVSENLKQVWAHFDYANFINEVSPMKMKEVAAGAIRTFFDLIKML